MYEVVSTAQHAARHTTAQHRTVPHARARPHHTAEHGTARRCSAELVLQCAAELSLAQLGPGMVMLREVNNKREAKFQHAKHVVFHMGTLGAQQSGE